MSESKFQDKGHQTVDLENTLMHAHPQSSEKLTPTPPLPDDPSSEKNERAGGVVEVEQKRPWSCAWMVQKLRSRCPRVLRSVEQLVRYIRGPETKTGLPDPVPYLNIDFTIRGRRIMLPLESTLSRFTRPLTSPYLFIILGVAYIISLAFFSRSQSFLTPSLVFLQCNSALWRPQNQCGLGGTDCEPFVAPPTNFRCPADCRSVTLQNYRTVGNERVIFEPLVVGGGDVNETYRGDSFLCAAAEHAGIFNDSTGGCMSVELIGSYTNFLPKTVDGLTSIGFPSAFPLALRFSPLDIPHCTDLRNPALAFNVPITALLFLVFRPRPTIVLFWSLVCIGFWHIALFSQPRDYPPPVGVMFGDFLPCLFVCYAFWRLAFRFTIPPFVRNAPIETAVLFLGPFWVALLDNLTLDKLPVGRLLSSDIRQRKGGLTTVILISLVVLAGVVRQILTIRKTGWLPHYLQWYTLGGLVSLVLALLPGLQFRAHHYIFAMAIIPITAFPTRLSVFAQGLALGLFLNGIAAFGFSSVVQTAAVLQRDGPAGTPLPKFLTNSSTYNASIPLTNQTVFWQAIAPGDPWTLFSLLVDDVEQYVGSALNYSLASLDAGIPHFFRLAFVGEYGVSDFTMPATLWPNGTWVDPLPGPS